MVSDRNMGSIHEGIALNYTNDKEHSDHINSSFKGNYYTWDEAQTICPSGWRLPTKDELDLIVLSMQFSDGRAYLVDANDNRCYFPLSGDGFKPSKIEGVYWSSTEVEDNSEGTAAWFLAVISSSRGVINNYKSMDLSVRCVKTAI